MANDFKMAAPIKKPGIAYGVLDQATGFNLRLAQISVFQDFFDDFARIGLKPADFSVLVIISENPGLKQSDVAEALGIQRANFVAIADDLEERGLAERRRSEDDRRIYHFYLTNHGKAFVKEMLETWAAHEEKLVAKLGGPDARDHLLNLLNRVVVPAD